MVIKHPVNLSGVGEGTTQTVRFTTTPFNEITEPGVYYNHETGWLYRIPGEILSLGHSPLLNIVSTNENFVTKISDDPWLPVSKARQICANMDLAVNF